MIHSLLISLAMVVAWQAPILEDVFVIPPAEMAATPPVLGPVELFWYIPACASCAGEYAVGRSAASGGPYTAIRPITIADVPEGEELVASTVDAEASGTVYYVILGPRGEVSNEIEATIPDPAVPEAPSSLTISVQ